MARDLALRSLTGIWQPEDVQALAAPDDEAAPRVIAAARRVGSEAATSSREGTVAVWSRLFGAVARAVVRSGA